MVDVKVQSSELKVKESYKNEASKVPQRAPLKSATKVDVDISRLCLHTMSEFARILVAKD